MALHTINDVSDLICTQEVFDVEYHGVAIENLNRV
jgi:hypothetical protein